MESGQRLFLGATTNSTFTYRGKHRVLEMKYGVGMIPLGDRNRAKPAYGGDSVEERDSDANIWRI